MVSLWKRLLGLGRGVVVEKIEFDQAGVVVAHVRVHQARRLRCGRCLRPGAGYDSGEGRRRWRGLDLGSVQVFLEGEAPRVDCRDCGVTVSSVPWARHDARHPRSFDDTVAWLVTRASKTTVAELMRVGWRTVGSILTRVAAEAEAEVDRLSGLRRIGIDEISYKRHQRYLTVVVDQVSGRLVWAAPGRNDATLHRFFALLGGAGCAAVTHVSADGADWITRVVAERCPQAVLGLDPFHVIRWATRALDRVRIDALNQARGDRPPPSSLRRVARPRRADPLKKARWPLWKNPKDLTVHQRHQLEWVAANHPGVWRAYRLKEGLRYVFAVRGEEGKEALDCWLRWASRSRLRPFVELAATIRRYRTQIDATLDHSLSNALAESVNAKIRLLTRVAFGFHRPEPLIALALLSLGGLCPPLPDRP